jgi:hypothetical protein
MKQTTVPILFLITLLCAVLASVENLDAATITVTNTNESGAGSPRAVPSSIAAQGGSAAPSGDVHDSCDYSPISSKELLESTKCTRRFAERRPCAAQKSHFFGVRPDCQMIDREEGHRRLGMVDDSRRIGITGR